MRLVLSNRVCWILLLAALLLVIALHAGEVWLPLPDPSWGS